MRTMRSTLSRSPTAACSVPSRSIATARAALRAGRGVDVAAELADPGLAVALGDVAGQEHEVAAAHERHVGGGRNGERRQRRCRVGEPVAGRSVTGRMDMELLAVARESRKSYTAAMREARDTGVAAGAALALAWLAGVGWIAAAAARAVAAPRAASQVALPPAGSALRCSRRGAGAAPFAARGSLGCGAALRRRSPPGWRAALRLAEALPPALEGRDLVVVGVVASLPQQGADGRALSLRGRVGARDGAPVAVPRGSRSAGTRGFARGRHACSEPQRSCAPGSAGASRVRLRRRTAT